MNSSASEASDARLGSNPADASGTTGVHCGDWLRILVDSEALRDNLAQFRRRIPAPARLLAVVKADGYGHGLLIAARAFLAGGADMLGVHSLAEVRELRQQAITIPLLVLGPLGQSEIAEASQLGAEITVGSLAMAKAAAAAAREGASCQIHLKVETGVYRQGILPGELEAVLTVFRTAPNVQLVGLSSHYADIEDTTDHSFARRQQKRFQEIGRTLHERGFTALCHHMSCSASAILWADSQYDLVRVGIAGYGIWPSRETFISARDTGQGDLRLRPALTWSCRVAQVKEVPAGETVGYGRTWKAPAPSRIAVLPVGYADGYPRSLSGRAHVLLRGRRASIAGRICMNLTMVDVTHIPGVEAGDEAVLLGRQGDEEITAEHLATLLNTIPYEIVTLPGPTWTRVVFPQTGSDTG
jgi:alanine racemase